MPANQNRKTESILLFFVLLVPVIWLALKLAPLFEVKPTLETLATGFNAMLENPLEIVWTEQSPRWLLMCVGGYAVGYLAYVTSRRNTLPQKEYGSAQWGDARKINARYSQSPAKDNLLFSEHLRLGLDSHKHRRNLNVLVIGGSGAGKTRYFAMPNLMQCNTSYVVTDPKGELCRSTGNLMREYGDDEVAHPAGYFRYR